MRFGIGWMRFAIALTKALTFVEILIQLNLEWSSSSTVAQRTSRHQIPGSFCTCVCLIAEAERMHLVIGPHDRMEKSHNFIVLGKLYH